MIKILQNVHTLVTTPEMMSQYARWIAHIIGFPPRLELPVRGRIEGFRNFSEFWSARGMVPDSMEVKFIRRFASEYGVILDVGANLGTHALTLATIRPGCIVHAFEPSPETFERLSANVVKNHFLNIETHLLALGEAPGKLKFNNDQSSPGTNRLINDSENSLDSLIDVDVKTIDGFLENYGDQQVAFLKIDVEGFEPSVLRGARHILQARRCQAGLIELCPENLYQVGSSPKELLDTVDELGFCLHFLNEEGLGSVVDIHSATSTVLANVALVPKDFSV